MSRDFAMSGFSACVHRTHANPAHAFGSGEPGDEETRESPLSNHRFPRSRGDGTMPRPERKRQSDIVAGEAGLRAGFGRGGSGVDFVEHPRDGDLELSIALVALLANQSADFFDLASTCQGWIRGFDHGSVGICPIQNGLLLVSCGVMDGATTPGIDDPRARLTRGRSHAPASGRPLAPLCIGVAVSNLNSTGR